jgi:hypothetical protein
MSEVTKLFEQRIGEWLTQARKKDAAFDKKVAESKKDVKGCCNYILSEVRKAKQCGYDDDEIYGMARHYFDEEDIKDPGKQKVSRIVVTGHVDLSDEEKAEAMEAAKKQYLAELRKEAEIKETIRKENVKKRKAQAENSQLDLFAGM